MGTTLENGVYLPSEGERNCYAGLKTNWEILDQKVADVTALQQAVAGALHREIVESLPTTDIDPNTIYMILSGTSATENVYNEYMYVNNVWELIGTSATDLTNYYTKAEVDGKLLLKASASDLTSHTGDTTIHVTANDKTKWNTVALIKQLRLVNAQVGSATTIAFANIDDTNGIKVGDKCMDLDGKLFEITAVDTTNQTVTVGSALIDLAKDSDVVHKSGNETINGNKTFSSNVNVYNSDSATDTANIILKNSKAERGSTTNTGEQTIFFLDKDNAQLGNIKCEVDASGVSTLTIQCTNSSNSNSGIRLRRTSTGTFLQPTFNNGCNLGTSGYRWYDVQTRAVNGVEPSSLSLPTDNASNVIDISSYITALDGTFNSYTVPANGWISIAVTGTAIAIVSSSWSDSRLRASSGNVRMLYPVLKNETVSISIAGTTLAYARFIPCQGNV